MTERLHFHALEKEMATHSSVLACRIPGTGEPGGLPSVGLQSRTRLKWLSSSSRSAVILHILCFGIAEISLFVLKMELIFLFLILLPPREGETAALYWAIIYSSGNFLIWTFSNLHRSRKHSMVNFFHSPITCFCIYQNFVKPGSSIPPSFFNRVS